MLFDNSTTFGKAGVVAQYTQREINEKQAIADRKLLSSFDSMARKIAGETTLLVGTTSKNRK